MRRTSLPPGLSAAKLMSSSFLAPDSDLLSTLMSVGAPYAPKRPSVEKTDFVMNAALISPSALPSGSYATCRKAPSPARLRTSTS